MYNLIGSLSTNMKRGFTLLELTIVVALIAIIAVTGIALLDPGKQIGKSWDSKRKAELNGLQKTLEDWYNDKSCYPTTTQICDGGLVTTEGDGSLSCRICGRTLTPAAFQPYLPTLPCDPQNTSNRLLLYHIPDSSCPSTYQIYTNLAIMADPAISQAGCPSGCGPNGTTSYNYGVASPGTGL